MEGCEAEAADATVSSTPSSEHSDIGKGLVPCRPNYRHKRKISSASRQRKSKPVIMNLSNCKYDVVRRVARSFKWIVDEEMDEFDISPENSGPGVETLRERETWNIMWMDCGVSPQRVMQLKPFQKINHFPGMHTLARKGALGRNLMALAKIFPTDFQFFPQTFVLPAQWNEFTHEIDSGKGNRTFIIKPDASCQGRGIFLTRSHENVSSTDSQVAQRYLHKPLLIDERKFDVRIYIVVTNVDPLRIFSFDDGLVRICAERYVEPKKHNFDKTRVHLTNYAINKESDKYVKNADAEEDGVSNKRSLTWFWNWVAEEHGLEAVRSIKKGINEMVIKSLISVHPFLAHTYRSCSAGQRSSRTGGSVGVPEADAREEVDPMKCTSCSSCFEVLGFDVLLDRNLKPWLIEVNHSPSFNTDSPLDDSIKLKLITKSLGLVNVSAGDKRRTAVCRKLGAQSRLYSKAGSSSAASAALKEQAENELKAALQQDLERLAKKEEESTNDGSFERIYPPADSDMFDHYQPYLFAAKRIFNSKAGSGALRRSFSERIAVRPPFGSSSSLNFLSGSPRDKLADYAARAEKGVAREKTNNTQKHRARAAVAHNSDEPQTTNIRRKRSEHAALAKQPLRSTVRGFDLEKFKKKGMARRNVFNTYLTTVPKINLNF